MAKFRVNKQKMDRLLKNLSAYKQRQIRKYTGALNVWSDDLVSEIGMEIQRVGAIDQGQLLGSTTHEGAHLEGRSLIKNTIFNPTEHATIIEFGRRPNQGKPPPLLPLVGWSGRKGITSHLPRNISFDGSWGKRWAAAFAIMKRAAKNRGGGRGGKKSSSTSIDPVILDLMKVIGISRSIHRKGIKGRAPFTRAFERKRKTFAKDIAAIVR